MYTQNLIMKYFRRNIFLSSLIILLITSCKIQEVKQDEYKGPINEFQTPETKGRSNKSNDLKQIHANRYKFRNEILDKEEDSDFQFSIIKKFEKYILNGDYVEQNQSQELLSILYLFNLAYKNLLQNNPRLLEEEKLLEKYQNSIFANCQDKIPHCENLKFFRNDPNTYIIVKYMATSLSPKIINLRTKLNKSSSNNTSEINKLKEEYYSLVDLYYSYLYACNEIPHSTENWSYKIYYLKHHQDYHNFFSDKIWWSKYNHNNYQYKRHLDIINIYLGDIDLEQDDSSLREKYCEFLLELNPLESNIKISSSSNKRNQEKLISDFITCASKKNILATYIKKQLTSPLTSTDINSNLAKHSFGQIEEDLQDDITLKNALQITTLASIKKSSFWNNLLGRDEKTNSPERDISFFIIDKYYNEEIDSSLAMNIWQNTKDNQDLKLMKSIDNYIKMRIAYLIKHTYKAFNEIILDEYEKNKVLGVDTISNSINHINKNVDQAWNHLKRRINDIRSLIIHLFNDKYSDISSHSTESKYFNSLKIKLERAPQHFNYLVVSPLMLGLSYYMSKIPGVTKFFIPWWPSNDQWATVDSSKVLSYFFTQDTAQMKPFFSFGELSYQFDEYQKPYILDYALKTGLFEQVPFNLYQNERNFLKEIPVDKKKFFNIAIFMKKYIKDYLSIYLNSVKNELHDLEQLNNDTAFWSRTSDLCNDPINAPMEFTLDKSNSYMSSITSTSFYGERNLFEKIKHIYKESSSLSTYISKLKHIDLIFSIIKNYYYNEQAKLFIKPAAYELREEIIDVIAKEIAEYKKPVQKYFTIIAKLDNFLVNQKQNCLIVFRKTDYLRQKELYYVNKEFYKDVHAAMVLLNILDKEKNSDNFNYNNFETLKGQIITWQKNANTQNIPINEINDVAGRMLNLAWKITSYSTQSLQNSSLNFHVFNKILSNILSIHNDENLHNFLNNGLSTNYQMGFYVHGIPTNEKLVSFNNISKQIFSQNKWDTILRLRQQIQNTQISTRHINQALDLNLTGEFNLLGPAISLPIYDLDNLYENYNESRKIVWPTNSYMNQEQFTRTAMRQFLGKTDRSSFFEWNTSTGRDIPYIIQRLKFLLNMNKLGPVEMLNSENNSCQKDIYGNLNSNNTESCKMLNITPSEIINYFLEIINVLNITEEEKTIITDLNLEGNNPELIRKLFAYKNEENSNEWTYFDEFYRRNFTSTEATNSASGISIFVDYINGKEEFLSHSYSHELNLKNNMHIVEPSKFIYQYQRNSIRSTIFRYLENIENFENYVTKLENSNADLPNVIFEYPKSKLYGEVLSQDGWREIKVQTREKGPRKGTPIYLSDNEKAKSFFDTYQDSFFIKDTNCKIMPTKGDPDYEAHKDFIISIQDLDCKYRYLKWKEYLDKKNKPEPHENSNTNKLVIKDKLNI